MCLAFIVLKLLVCQQIASRTYFELTLGVVSGGKGTYICSRIGMRTHVHSLGRMQ